MRIGELTQLKWIDLDYRTQNTQNHTRKRKQPPNPTNKRQTNRNDKQTAENPQYNIHNNIPTPQRHTSRLLMQQRKTLAQKLNNPRIKQISFHTLRHWKGTMEYHNTKDIMHVKYVLGHKNININNDIHQPRTSTIPTNQTKTSHAK